MVPTQRPELLGLIYQSHKNIKHVRTPTNNACMVFSPPRQNYGRDSLLKNVIPLPYRSLSKLCDVKWLRYTGSKSLFKLIQGVLDWSHILGK